MRYYGNKICPDERTTNAAVGPLKNIMASPSLSVAIAEGITKHY